MQRFFKLSAILVLLAFSGPSCEMLDDCKYCKYVTYEDGVLVSEGSEVEYCGEELMDIEDQDPVVVLNSRSQYECY